jgi:Zn-finger nucleic acid-binding protein
MGGPYRDPELPCPACRAPLRTFNARLCCDACNGIFLELDDLARSIADLTGAAPELAFKDDRPGTRRCPRCAAAMTACHLVVTLGHRHPRLPPELDRCGAHGVWFDELELAKIYELLHLAVAGVTYGHGKALFTGRTKF